MKAAVVAKTAAVEMAVALLVATVVREVAP